MPSYYIGGCRILKKRTMVEAHVGRGEARIPTFCGGGVFVGVPSSPNLRELAKGVDVNAKSERGKTALMLAANFRNAKVVQTLLDAGASADETDDRGWKTAAFVENNILENNEKEHDEIRQLLQKARTEPIGNNHGGRE
jgi:Ankyrin repeats (many copies)